MPIDAFFLFLLMLYCCGECVEIPSENPVIIILLLCLCLEFQVGILYRGSWLLSGLRENPILVVDVWYCSLVSRAFSSFVLIS